MHHHPAETEKTAAMTGPSVASLPAYTLAVSSLVVAVHVAF